MPVSMLAPEMGQVRVVIYVYIAGTWLTCLLHLMFTLPQILVRVRGDI